MTPIVVLDILMEKGLQLIDLDAKESWLGGGAPLLDYKGTLDEIRRLCVVQR